jgi:hypothetical protein
MGNGHKILDDWILHQLIEERAYSLWIENNCQPNMELTYWLMAEKEILELYQPKKEN